MIKYYSEKPAHNEVEPNGWLSLEGCVVEEDLGSESGFQFSVKAAAGRRMVLSVESDMERTNWLAAIKIATSSPNGNAQSLGNGSDVAATFRIFLSNYGRNIYLRACDAETCTRWIQTVRSIGVGSLLPLSAIVNIVNN